MITDAAHFDVLLGSADEIPMALIAESIAQFKKIPFQDAAHDARLAWGFLGRNLSEPAAQELVAILNKKSLPSRVVPSGSLAALPTARVVKQFEMDSVGLRFTDIAGTIEAVPFERLKVIAAMGLPTRLVTTEKIIEGPTNAQKVLNVGLLLSGIPVSVGKKKRMVEKTTVTEDMLFYVDLLFKDPAVRYRIDAQSLNYAFLKERMLHNTLINFKLLLKDLVQATPRALINRGTRFLIKNQTLGQMGYESIAHLEQETLWLSAL